MSPKEIEEALAFDDEAPLQKGEHETVDEWEEKRRRKGEAVELVRAQEAAFALFSLVVLFFFAACFKQKATDEIVTVPAGEVVFTDVVGGPWPTPFGVKILPSTGGLWTSHDTSPWFDTSPHNSGNAGDECVIKPHTEELSAGVHSQVITFKSNGLPDKQMIVNVVMMAFPPSPTPATPTAAPAPTSTLTPRPSIGPAPTTPTPGKVTPTPGATARPTPPGIAATAPPEEPTPNGQVLLTWLPSSTPPGSLPVAGYRVYWGLASATYSQEKSVGLATTALVYAPSQSWFAVKAYNTVGIESGYSNEVRHP